MDQSYRQLLFPCLTMLTTVMLTLLLVVGPTPGNGAVSVPVKVTYSAIYRIRSRSLLPLGLFYIIQGVSDVQCYARCLLSTRCLSVNYKRTNQTCEMSSMSENTAPSATPITLIQDDGYHYMDKIDIPIGLSGQCVDSSVLGGNCETPAPSCSLDDKTGHIIEEKGGELLAHTSCQINGLTERCDTGTNTWLSYTPNCAGTPPQVRSNARYTLYESYAEYDCVDSTHNVTFSKYDVVTRTWSLPDIDCTPLLGPPRLPVAGVETFVVRPYAGVASEHQRYNGDYCHVQHKCRSLTGSTPISSCPVSRCDGHFNWTVATLSCSEYDCYDSANTRYGGRMSCTVGGIPCQRWDTDTPHIVSVFIAIVNKSVVNDWCLQTGVYRPWCYTTDPSIWSRG